MLIIKPNCEYCDKTLSAQSSEAMICSYECTFCQDCVNTVLYNVCPNCGGGFSARPIRPTVARRENTSLIHQPASSKAVHSPYSFEEISQFVQAIKDIKPQDR
ncbi:DUF1272 domain-containing protein [Marinomonas sp.]|nr:DUF1272 domain-containing protein [Marinomonas sp.]MDB4837415.1 DUF1272 domain-containing protein [Marinomonas sp.]